MTSRPGFWYAGRGRKIMGGSGNGRAYAYSVDTRDLIDAVDEAWLGFARANGAPELTAEAVLGQPLYRYLAGEETRHWYRLILDKVRRVEGEMRLPFRCDGPTVRRFMELRIRRHGPAGVAFVGRLVREEAREAMALFDAATSRSADSLAVCPWCKLVSVDGAWLEVEDAVAKLGLFEAPRLPRVAHGVCDRCHAHLAREVREPD
jgi:hypothetical protein